MPIYTLSNVQTDRKTPTVSYNRNNATSINFWPRLQVMAALPVGNEIYRKTQVVLQTPLVQTVTDMPDSVKGLSIFDLTAKHDKFATAAEIEASFDAFVLLLQQSEIRASIVDQARLTSDVDTSA